ncbi:GNAT family N-acetyltransferase [Candidatus Halocynthiibacter alkanivorans]|uniref:GNAT family N-acetyltransferase n=1 Tax=Candidatus Halocynthiibacter alkanivorans TaxID=2267619 RepID=UPI00135A7168|nr:GNAT family N-acetyltransferase [Candidatus Halocynthiibacter alkanivorans]
MRAIPVAHPVVADPTVAGPIRAGALLLRPTRLTDAADLAALMSPEISRWVASWPPRLTTDACTTLLQQSLTRPGLVWHFTLIDTGIDTGADAGTDASSGTPVGALKLHREHLTDTSVEIGYWIGSAFHGRGFATSAAQTAITYAFDVLGMKSVTAGAQLANEASNGLLQKLGMTRLGDAQIFAPARGRFEPCSSWEITAP